MSRRFTNLDHARSWQFLVTTSGIAEKLTIKQVASTIAFNSKGRVVTDTSGFSQSLDTITDSANGFFGSGLRTGDQLVVTGAGANSGTYVIYEISATGGTITLTSSGSLTTVAAGSAITLTASVTVPEGISMTIHALKTNTQKVYIGTSQLNAQGHKCFTLSPGDVVGLQVRKSDIMWLDVDVSGEGVEVITEQNKQGVE